MRNHHEREPAAQSSIRNQVLLPELPPRFLNYRQCIVAVEFALSQTREVLPASENSSISQPRQKLAGVQNGFLRVRRHQPRTHHAARSFKRQIDSRGKIDIESECPAVFADYATVFPRELTIPCSKYISRRRCGSNHVAEPVHFSALKVDTPKKWRHDLRLAIFEQLPGLFGIRDVSCEENDTCRLNPLQQRSERR